ncbi:L-arabinose transporter ATP-binding protein, partial [Burkholderia sp. TJI49]
MTMQTMTAVSGHHDAAQAGAGAPPAGEPVLALDGITVTFPGVRALDAVSLSVRAGEVHGLMGENGAG